MSPDEPADGPHGALLRALETHFGFSSFRPRQEEIVSSILSGRDVFAALPTGGGKSLCYQLPALFNGGLTVVVSPLISLMKDQVDAARENGIAAAYLNSSLSLEKAQKTWKELSAGRVRLLYLSPERLSRPAFRASLQGLGVTLFAVDEAHCISEWGHEFRPDYLTLGELRGEFPHVPIAAFTATATRQVQDDVIRRLKLHSPLTVRTSFDRSEIYYAVTPKDNVEKQILDFVARHRGEPGIVYRSSRKAVERTADSLDEAGFRAVAYHAGFEDEERRRRQDAFVRDEVEVVVATIAFGMGIDKSNVRWIVHGDLPRSLEAYYQETGRAARDGEPAETVMFYGPKDVSTIRYHIERMEVPEERERAEARLLEVLRFADSGICRRKLLLGHFDEEHPGGCGNCDVCTDSVAAEDFTEQAQKILSAAHRTGERFGGYHLADIVCGNATDRVLDLGHNQLPTFGVGSDHDRTWWLSLLRDLESGGYLARKDGPRSGFRITPAGRSLLRGRNRFSAVRRQEPAELGSRAGRNAVVGQGAPEDSEEAERLFQCLRSVRLKLARQRNVPPYVIFSDKTLRALVRERPTDPEAMLRCPGVGKTKLARYGDIVLEAVRSFLSGQSCP
ncbi:MAG: DNA helicase RecQ [Spirochaetales bacterium]|nr:DNA helicase RecQ [Spirochaetales bacterium]MCF7936962.1 DNA helicase RecQ [Spirochaetales bacterium]